MKYLTSCLMALCLASLTFASVAQNHVWTLPPNNLELIEDYVSPLPVPVPLDGIAIDDYAGQDAMNGHNGIFYPNGDIAFFAVDDMLYHKDGYLMYQMLGDYTHAESITPNGEICIVPDPRILWSQVLCFCL